MAGRSDRGLEVVAGGREGTPPAQLPSGRHGLSRRFVVSNQRERILSAVTWSVADNGYAATTVGDIVTTARLSRRTFYEHFEDKEECFLAAYDAAIDRVVSVVYEAHRGASPGADQIRASLEAFIQLMIDEPELTRLCLVEVVAAGPEALRQRERAMQRFADTVWELGREHIPDDVDVPPLAANLVVGGIYEIVKARVLGDRVETLFEELPQMIYCVLVPFCGHGQASAIAAEAKRLPPGESLASASSG